MKKLLLVALAVVGLASCVQNEELVVPQNTAAISFDSFVGNATKADPSYNESTKPLEKFMVWAFMDKVAGNVFTEEVVTNNGGVWSYQNLQYWYPKHTYYFSALAPVENAHWSVDVATDDAKAVYGLGTVSFTNVDGTEDLLYAKAKETTPADAATLANNGMPAVEMDFQHLLSKVKFTFQNGFNANNTTVEVSGVTMSAPKKGTIDLAQQNYATEWVLDNETITLAFGNVANPLALAASAEAADERLTIPADATKEYAVSFHVKVYQGEVLAMESDINATISGIALEMGKAYNFTAVINQDVLDLKPIQFTASVSDWTEGLANDVIKGKAIATAAELAEAVKTSGDYVLVEDITVDADETMTVAAGNHVVLYLNGKTIYAQSDKKDSNRNLFDVRGGLVVKAGNETLTSRATTGNVIEYKHVGENMGWGASTNIFNVTAGGILTLEGITAKNLGGSDMGFVAHLNNWGEVTLNAANCVLESNYVAVRVFNSGYDMNNVTIKNSTLKGNSAAFWVHNYTAADFGSETKAEAQKALLNLNIYNQGNTFSPDVNGIRYGFTNAVRSDAYGITKSVSEDGSVVTLGTVVEDGLVRRGVVGAEENTTIKKVVVGEGITTLYDRTFRSFYALEEVILPSTLTTIGAAGSGVFQSCTNLKSVVIPESVTVLGKGTFQECASLESINIPAGVTRIEENCLRATGIKKIEFHEGVTYFGAQAFRDCKQLKEVTINAPQFTVEANCFGSMAAPYPAFTIYVANAEMKAYLESTLTYANQCKIVVPSTVSTAEALKEAINAGEQTIHVTGQIDLTEEILANYNGTIIGADDTACINTRTFVVKSADEAFHLGDKTINFKNITIKVPTEDGDFLKTGFVAAGTMNFDHCVFEGQVTLNGGATWTFDDCEFGGADSGVYASFVYGAKKVTFNRCSFSGVDRAAKVYGSGGVIDVEYNNCTFTSTTSNKYAVNIDASYATTKVALNGCSQTGMPGLYLVAGTKATVYVDGVQQ